MKTDWMRRILRSPITWALAGGGTGLVCGYQGNSLLAANPGSVGPVVGIFLTGPGALILGVFVSLFLFRRPLTNLARAGVLAVFLAFVVLGSLSLTVPEYVHEAELLNAQVIACEDLEPLVQGRIPHWRSEAARLGSEGRTVRQQWEAALPQMIAESSGVVLTLRRSRAAWFRKQIWRFGMVNRRFDGWEEQTRDEKVLFLGPSSCDDMPTNQNRYFLTCWKEEGLPPEELSGFLGVSVVYPIPDDLLPEVQRGRRDMELIEWADSKCVCGCRGPSAP